MRKIDYQQKQQQVNRQHNYSIKNNNINSNNNNNKSKLYHQHQYSQQQQHQQSYSSQLSSQQQSSYEYQQQKINNNINTTITPTSQKPIKMIQFIDQLYKKYKVLNKLSQQQSNNFQTQIITMLIDQNQCLDQQLYQSTISKIGLSTFLLQILDIVIQKRNKFQNQYQMNKNIQAIVKQLDKQRIQLNKRKKQIDKKQMHINKQKLQLYTYLQQKAKQIEQKSIKNILSTEQQIKKRVKQLTLSLKTKQKQLNDKTLTMRQNLKKIKQLQTQQKAIEDKIKLLQKKQKQRKLKQANIQQQQQSNQQSNKKINQLNTKILSLQQINKKLQDEIQKLNKKIKTNQMANKHYKDQTEKKMVKVNQMVQRIKGLERQKQQLQKRIEIKDIKSGEWIQKEQMMRKQTEIIKKQMDCMRKQTNSMKKQVQRMKRQLVRSESIINELKKQNQTLLSKIKDITLLPNYYRTNNNINMMILPQFEQLDISKINPLQQISKYSYKKEVKNSNIQGNNILLLKQQSQQCQQQGKEKQQQQYSIIDKMGESLMIEGDGQLEDNNDISYNNRNRLLLGYKQYNSVDSSQQQQSIIATRQREYFRNSNTNKNQQQNKYNYKQSRQDKLINNQTQNIAITNIKFNNTKKSPIQSSPQSINRQQPSLLLQESNIKLFDNYFNIKPNNNNNIKPNNNNINNKNSTSIDNSKNQSITKHDDVLREISDILNSTNNSNQCMFLDKLTSDKLTNWVTIITSQLKYPKTLIQPLLQLLLTILQPCTCIYHTKTLPLLFTSNIINFLQQTLLKYQAIIPTIQQKSIIILSRILLSYQNTQQKTSKFILKQNYLKSIKVKSLIEKDQFILSNIKFLMDYQ